MIQIADFWFMAQCSDAVGFQFFGRPSCLHLHYPEDHDLDLCEDLKSLIMILITRVVTGNI
jgi:hypothetical protein